MDHSRERAGGLAMLRGARIRFAESRRIRWKCRGFAIRYSLLTSGSSSSAVSLLLSCPVYRAPRCAPPSHANRVCVSFVLRRALCVTYGPRVIYHTAAAADRERDAFNRTRRSPGRLIMVILSRRCKLRRACAHSDSFAREKARTN